MRILVISDTHGNLNRCREVFHKLQKENPVQLIVHCGDYYEDAQALRLSTGVPVVAVKGNCDGEYSEKNSTILSTEAGDFLVTHGHMEKVSYDLETLYYKVLESDCIGALFGHTHRSAFVDMDGIYMMNPGSLPSPRDGSGGTFGILVTEADNVWGRIFRYEDFMKAGADSSSGGSGGSGSGGSGSGGSDKKSKVKGGKLRDMLNYSDRF